MRLVQAPILRPSHDLLPGPGEAHPVCGEHPSPRDGVALRAPPCLGLGGPHTSTCAAPGDTERSRAAWPVPGEVAALPRTAWGMVPRPRQAAGGILQAQLTVPAWLTQSLAPPAATRWQTGLRWAPPPALLCAVGSQHQHRGCGRSPKSSTQRGDGTGQPGVPRPPTWPRGPAWPWQPRSEPPGRGSRGKGPWPHSWAGSARARWGRGELGSAAPAGSSARTRWTGSPPRPAPRQAQAGREAQPPPNSAGWGGGSGRVALTGWSWEPPKPEVMSTACSFPAGKGGAALFRPAWWAEQAAPRLGLTGPPQGAAGCGVRPGAAPGACSPSPLGGCGVPGVGLDALHSPTDPALPLGVPPSHGVPGCSPLLTHPLAPGGHRWSFLSAGGTPMQTGM